MKKILNVFFGALLLFSLASCENNIGNNDNNNENGNDVPEEIEITVEAKDFVASRKDTREAKYVFYTADGEEVDTFVSLYSAIAACVDEGDTEDYVALEDSEEKLFINYERFDDTVADMYWYYNPDGTLAEYVAWADNYWLNLRNKEYISVYKSGDNGTVSYYANGYQVVKLSTNVLLPKLNQVQSYHTCWELEANATVDLVAYSGITMAEYHINLSEAKITPSYDGTDSTYAYVGFVTSDAFNVSNHGLRCDTKTGNWYYYSGETSWNSNSIKTEKDCYLTSTWNEEGGYFTPDGDIVMKMELLTLLDEDGDDYIVHRLTVDFGNGRVLVKDYETSKLTQCGTIRFTTGLDIVSDNTLVDYMNGAKFENVVVTKAEGTMYEEMQDDAVYGNFPELFPGTFDLLNSNPESHARFQTIIYNPACVTYDFSTPGKDVYSYSFE